jgi:hypothetical protein
MIGTFITGYWAYNISLAMEIDETTEIDGNASDFVD